MYKSDKDPLVIDFSRTIVYVRAFVRKKENNNHGNIRARAETVGTEERRNFNFMTYSSQ